MAPSAIMTNRNPHNMESRHDNSDLRGEPIHVYTRAQAIADGILVDLSTAPATTPGPSSPSCSKART